MPVSRTAKCTRHPSSAPAPPAWPCSPLAAGADAAGSLGAGTRIRSGPRDPSGESGSSRDARPLPPACTWDAGGPSGSAQTSSRTSPSCVNFTALLRMLRMICGGFGGWLGSFAEAREGAGKEGELGQLGTAIQQYSCNAHAAAGARASVDAHADALLAELPALLQGVQGAHLLQPLRVAPQHLRHMLCYMVRHLRQGCGK